MAAPDSNGTPQKHCTLIECRNKSQLPLLIEIIQKHITDTFSKDDGVSLTEDLRNAVCQATKTALISNLNISGNGEHGLNTTNEHEPIDQNKEEYIRQDLMRDWNNHMVSTAAMRTNAPKQIQKHVKKLYKHELKYLMESSVEKKQEAMETDQGNSDAMDLTEFEQRVHASSERWNTVQQDCEDMKHKVDDIIQATRTFSKSEKSAYTQALFETPPNSPGPEELQQTRDHVVKSIQISRDLLQHSDWLS